MNDKQLAALGEEMAGRAMDLFEQKSPHQLAVELAAMQGRCDAALAEARKFKLNGLGMAASFGEASSAYLELQGQRDQLADQLADATQQCGAMAELLREAKVFVGDIAIRETMALYLDGPAATLLKHIDALLAGQVPDYVEQPRAMVPELTDELRAILGRPNFSCSPIAMALRIAGHSIEYKSEHEQAAVIHWLLGFYYSHGDKWNEAAKAALKDMRDASAQKLQGGE